jgi:hypothetical protein
MFQINVAAAEEEDSRQQTADSSSSRERSSTVLQFQRGVLQFYSSRQQRTAGSSSSSSIGVPVPGSSSRQQHLPCLRGSCYLLGCVMYTLDKVYSNLFIPKFLV